MSSAALSASTNRSLAPPWPPALAGRAARGQGEGRAARHHHAAVQVAVRATRAGRSRAPTSAPRCSSTSSTSIPRIRTWPERDFWHFSIGHVTPVIYSLMAERGYFPLRDLMKFRTVRRATAGASVARTTRPASRSRRARSGQGLSVCCGVAMAARIDDNPRRVYCVMGDGEQQEGQIWEAAMFAAHYKLDNLCAHHRLQPQADRRRRRGHHGHRSRWPTSGARSTGT